MNFRLVVVLGTVLAQGYTVAQLRTVEIFVNNQDDSVRLLSASKPLVSNIFGKIGVQLTWHKGDIPAGRNALGIRTAEHAPATASREALAASELRGPGMSEITIYKDRLQSLLNLHPNVTRVLAAYVLAHEFAHVMQGVPRHSDSGIMKAHWSDRDFQEMIYHKLVFAPVDLDLIQKGLATMAAVRSTPAGEQLL
jgi:hypothetical protein